MIQRCIAVILFFIFSTGQSLSQATLQKPPAHIEPYIKSIIGVFYFTYDALLEKPYDIANRDAFYELFNTKDAAPKIIPETRAGYPDKDNSTLKRVDTTPNFNMMRYFGNDEFMVVQLRISRKVNNAPPQQLSALFTLVKEVNLWKVNKWSETEVQKVKR